MLRRQHKPLLLEIAIANLGCTEKLFFLFVWKPLLLEITIANLGCAENFFFGWKLLSQQLQT